MKKILLVEDDESLGTSLTSRLEQNYEVKWAQTSKSAIQFFKADEKFDLVLLDIGLPDGSGFDLAERIRESSKVQFLFLTAQADAESRLRGFELGAEEFIPKPFHLKELLIRIEHIFKLHEPKEEKIVLKGCAIDFQSMSIQKNNEPAVFPSVNEMRVLRFMIEKSPQVVSRDQIMDSVWGVDKFPSHRTIDNIILHLRNLLGNEDEACIRSVRGVGYQWVKEVGEK